ncbi:UDP-N-acetylmuramate--L-alanine ligase [Thermodesulfatator autotrophicus]|uniref:UDP-N-acetylmuramate--L-alanine ligase n=1 Tax=Thermodesulfatator autotrophicus TaxID=1795632 RepID=A0A177E9X4_9BACT|nr:UDP-N-acetylmuramate--L-alanine ligase [Thermodesulfatator autotrophicus]OAG27992.1 UDP-N-acetylmuramate--alanine ligase [Thermodesulfatator autotrophicus]
MREYKRVHFVGIGGIGMSGLARLLLRLGFEVSGSDLNPSETTKMLADEGAIIFYGHHPKQVEGADLVVYSSAVSQDNPELKRAKELGLKVMPRAQMLVEIMELHRFNLVVTGAHGKTTTTSMLASVLTKGGLSPTVVVGGKVNGFDGNAWLGDEREYLLAEADESDGSFLRMSPDLAIITNIDKEHLDFYRDFEEILEAFAAFVDKVKGKVIVCLDDEGVKRLLQRKPYAKYITYGFDEQAFYRARIIKEGARSVFTVFENDNFLGEVMVPFPGKHNILNALATVALARTLKIPFKKIREGLSAFKGVRRRFDLKGQVGEILVFDDYAHHPKEIEATIRAFKNSFPERRLVILFQPHRFTRTKALFDDFVRCFDEAEVLLVTDIYPASEKPIPGVTGEALAKALSKRRKGLTYYVPGNGLALARVLDILKPGDVFVTMGAGNIYRLGEKLLEELGLRQREVA